MTGTDGIYRPAAKAVHGSRLRIAEDRPVGARTLGDRVVFSTGPESISRRDASCALFDADGHVVAQAAQPLSGSWLPLTRKVRTLRADAVTAGSRASCAPAGPPPSCG